MVNNKPAGYILLLANVQENIKAFIVLNAPFT